MAAVGLFEILRMKGLINFFSSWFYHVICLICIFNAKRMGELLMETTGYTKLELHLLPFFLLLIVYSGCEKSLYF